MAASWSRNPDFPSSNNLSDSSTISHSILKVKTETFTAQLLKEFTYRIPPFKRTFGQQVRKKIGKGVIVIFHIAVPHGIYELEHALLLHHAWLDVWAITRLGLIVWGVENTFNTRFVMVFLINPLTLRTAKRGLTILGIFYLLKCCFENIWRRNVYQKRTTTLLQISCNLSLYSQAIFKSKREADDTFERNSKHEWVKIRKHLHLRGEDQARK